MGYIVATAALLALDVLAVVGRQALAMVRHWRTRRWVRALPPCNPPSPEPTTAGNDVVFLHRETDGHRALVFLSTARHQND